ncbi:2'-5' RNA ligase family protein [Saccharomonospora piscinae]|uniref:2'-5' RNA ligase family protein n=1 Tax=Saccharomonospora piscinae TaxID=687388 RepID=UPI00207BB864|nr:2'-5' RNA ligase family protein [Saccharomonospora piscinae]
MTAGHSVLAVAVPAFEDYIQRRTAHYDASFLSSDPAFSHAHITVLGPWLTTPSQPDLDTVERIVAAAEPFDTTLARVETFPDGLIHLRPDPDEPFRALTAALVDAFPHCPPYGGRFPDPVLHLTLDRRAETITRTASARICATCSRHGSTSTGSICSGGPTTIATCANRGNSAGVADATPHATTVRREAR